MNLVGWGRDFRNEGFGEQTGIKSQLISLITAVQTLLRGRSGAYHYYWCLYVFGKQ